MKVTMSRFYRLLLIIAFGLNLAVGTVSAEDGPAGSNIPSVNPDQSVSQAAPSTETQKQVPGDQPAGETAREKSDIKGKMVFNFDDADLAEVIRTLADLLQINYVLDPGVGGKVTVHTAGELGREDLLPVFYQVLEVNGLTAVKQKNFYRIVPIKDAPRLGLRSKTGPDGKAVSPDEQVVIQIIRLKFVSVSEISKLLAPFVSAEGTIVTRENSNLLVIVDKAYNITKILRLVKVFDTDVFETVSYRFYPLKNADADTLAGILDKMFVSYGQGVKDNINVIPLTRLNALLVLSSNPKVFDELAGFIKKYDVPSQSTEPGIYVYPIKNGQAADIADLLNKVFTGKKETKAGKQGASIFRNPLEIGAKKEKAAAEEKKPASAPSPGAEVAVGSGTLRGEVKITADEYRNSLIIEAAPDDYRIIKNLLAQIDVLPRQVLIEVTIAEVTLDKSSQMGVEWTYVKGPERMSTSLLNAAMGKAGLQYAVGSSERWVATMSALASKNRVNILSSPSILASNSKPAKIDISTEIPVASSQYNYTSGETPVISTDIQYRDTGVMLSVTPHINELGLVTMDIQQEVSEQSQNVQVGDKDYPSFFKRSASTTLAVQDGQTIAIGGLIKQTKSKGAAGTPWFVHIPVISFLFGNTSESLSKTELIILISPHVVARADDVDAVTKEFKEKMGSLFNDSGSPG